MPYIKPTYRKILKPLIDDISYIDTTDKYTIESVYNQFLEVLEYDIEPEKRDSIWNYVFTFILLHHTSVASRQFIWHVLKEEFLYEPSYEKLERCVGLLNCMISEFKRRHWSIHVSDLKALCEIVYARYLGVYELEKLEQNGDI